MINVHVLCINREKFTHAVEDDEYEILKKLAQGKFSKPVKERMNKEKSAVVKFWRAKGMFTLSDEIQIYCYMMEKR